MVVPHRPARATFQDLAALDGAVEAEIVGGELVQRANPTMAHGRSQLALGGALRRRYDRRPGGRWPGGWWFGTEVDVEYGPHELFRHDVVGWRRDLAPVCPTGRPVRQRPDWVCELLSPSNEARDRIDKLRVLHAAGVPHYWIANPEDHTLVVHRWEPGGYLIALTATGREVVRAEPFEAVELALGVLFGVDDDED